MDNGCSIPQSPVQFIAYSSKTRRLESIIWNETYDPKFYLPGFAHYFGN
jgi:hypothetical protein